MHDSTGAEQGAPGDIQRILGELDETVDRAGYLSEVDLCEVLQTYCEQEGPGAGCIDEQSEFLVQASKLVRQKAAVFAGSGEADDGEDDEPEDELHSDQLVAQLLEYRRYQQVASELSRRAEDMRQRYTRVPPEILEWEEALADIEGADLSDLVLALESLLVEEEEPVETIEREPLSVQDCMDDIRDKLSGSDGPLEFSEIFTLNRGRQVIVVTFVALLELIRRREVMVAQDKRFGPIMLYSVKEGGDAIV